MTCPVCQHKWGPHRCMCAAGDQGWPEASAQVSVSPPALKGSILLGPAAEPRLNVSSVFCSLMFGMGNVRILTADKGSVVRLQQNGWKKKEFDNLRMNTCTPVGKLVIGRNLWEYHGLEMKETTS